VMDGLSRWPVMASDYGMVRDGCQFSEEAGISMWDALIVVAAKRCGADGYTRRI
jgi:predicted nucleic acid-binding protein